MFAEAHALGRTAELDWACRLAALRTALDSGLDPACTLFLNVEPSSIGHAWPAGADEVLTSAQGRFRIMLELTERALFVDPAKLVATVDMARRRGWGTALDDVGADPASLALLPFIEPDVIKLDLSLIQQAPRAAQAEIMTAVIAHAESTGATVLAEGIETPAHVDRALALGSSLGQGWHFSRAGSLPSASPPITAPIALATSPRQIPQTPFDLVADHPALRRAPKSLLTRFSRFVEDHALSLPAPPIVLGAFQTAERFTPATAERYARIADRCPLVGALGERLPRRYAACGEQSWLPTIGSSANGRS